MMGPGYRFACEGETEDQEVLRLSYLLGSLHILVYLVLKISLYMFFVI